MMAFLNTLDEMFLLFLNNLSMSIVCVLIVVISHGLVWTTMLMGMQVVLMTMAHLCISLLSKDIQK